jgi:hypothetical protein
MRVVEFDGICGDHVDELELTRRFVITPEWRVITRGHRRTERTMPEPNNGDGDVSCPTPASKDGICSRLSSPL